MYQLLPFSVCWCAALMNEYVHVELIVNVLCGWVGVDGRE